jgi:hypothetical protein
VQACWCCHADQGSQAPPADFDQLVEGPWPISTSCPPGGLCGGASAFWREIWSKFPLFRVQKFDHLIEDPSKISEISGLRPKIFDPSMSLRALMQTADASHPLHCKHDVTASSCTWLDVAHALVRPTQAHAQRNVCCVRCIFFTACRPVRHKVGVPSTPRRVTCASTLNSHRSAT